MKQGQIRIIGGKWRGRKLQVPDSMDLRPTPDRVRETLFNWLAPIIEGSYCLDLFSGSGALGFEALSRGASHVVMIDNKPAIVTLLQQELRMFNVSNADIYCANVPEQLKQPEERFNIIFLDPPYRDPILLPCCFYLEEHAFLADDAIIYLEARQTLTDSLLPPNWKIIKSKVAGQVAYHLVRRSI